MGPASGAPRTWFGGPREQITFQRTAKSEKSNRMRVGRLQLALGLGLSGVCLWLALRKAGIAELRVNLGAADYRWLLIYPLLATALNIIRADIWRVLLWNRVTRAEAFWGYGAGFLVNNVVPLRVGEAVRIALVANRRRLPLMEVAAAAGLERILDLLFVIVILSVTVPFVTDAFEIRQVLTMLIVVVLFAVGAVVLLAVCGDQCNRLMAAGLTTLVPRYAAPLLRRWHELMMSIAVLRRPSLALRVVSCSLTVWVITVVLQWTVLRAFQPAAGLLDSALLVGLLSIAAAVPAAPGAIGISQWVGQQALALPFPHLYTPASALAVAFVSHGTAYLFSSTLGAIGLWYFGIPLGHLTRLNGYDTNPPVVQPKFGPSSAID